MNRAIHELSTKSDVILRDNLKKLQEIPRIAIKSTGVIVLDEHIIPKTSKHIEGVDYFHTTSGDKNILGLSMKRFSLRQTGKIVFNCQQKSIKVDKLKQKLVT